MNFAPGADSGEEGLARLAEVLAIDPEAVVVMVTAHGDVELAVEAMKKGAADFVTKPWENERLLATLMAALNLRRSRLEAAELRQRNQRAGGGAPMTESGMIGTSPAMLRVFGAIRRTAPTDANVLILGENGTGKELVAREIHRLSARASEVFLRVDMGALSPQLFESELFGHRRGAFTDAKQDRTGYFRAATGGTLFLDEIGNVPLHLQSKLLTALERREVVPVGAEKPEPIDVRLICATNLQPRAAGRRKPVPPGPALSHQHGGDHPAARCASGRRTSRCCWSITPRSIRRNTTCRPSGLSAALIDQLSGLVLARQCARPAPCGGTRRDPERRRHAGRRRIFRWRRPARRRRPPAADLAAGRGGKSRHRAGAGAAPE